MENAFTEYVKTHRGAQAAIAKAAMVTRSSVCQWQASGVPANKVMLVSDMTGIPPHVLRPDVFKPPVELRKVWSSQGAD